MGIADSSISNLIAKLRSWVSWRGDDLSGISKEYWMPDESCRMCYDCDLRFSVLNRRHHCRSCGRVFCSKCMQEPGVISSHGELREQLKFCKFCFQAIGRDADAEFDEKLDLVMSPRQSFDSSQEKLSTSQSPQTERHEQFDELHGEASPYGGLSNCAASAVDLISPLCVRCCASRSIEEVTGDIQKHVLCPSNKFYGDMPDLEASSTGNIFCNSISVDSSPLDNRSLVRSSPNSDDDCSLQPDQGESPSFQNKKLPDEETNDLLRSETDAAYMERAANCINDLSIFQNQSYEHKQVLDFEDNGLIWFPPSPEVEGGDTENNFFEYNDDDDDDDDAVGASTVAFSSSSFSNETFSSKEISNIEHKEPLRAMVHGHFRALVLQLLKGEGLCTGNEIGGVEWLEPVASLSWQAANFMKPDTSRGGSMDPGNYVKVKCMPSGNPCESTLIRGVVCTKNVKHKRMISQYKNPKLLLLAGALEYQRIPNQLSSMDTLLQQEIDHLKMTVAKIEAHHPNVLLVEKSVSSYAQEYLLAKDISLVLNVRIPLLERIAKCTGAHITPSIDNLASARLGHCETFRLQKVTEKFFPTSQLTKRSSKTLMFFEGCPTRLGCTILLRGKSLEELKKVKHVVQYAVFAAYHLSLETSFLADEGASLPKMSLKPSIAMFEPVKNDDAISTICSQSVASCKTLLPVPQGESFVSNRVPGLVNTSDVSRGPDLILGFRSDCEGCKSTHDCFDVSCSNVVSDGVISDLQDAIMWNASSLLSASKNVSLTSSVEDFIRGVPRNHVPSVKACDIQNYNVSSEYFSTPDNSQSILVSYSSRCVLKGTVCERSQLFRIKFYGSFDKPLGRFLRDDIFDQSSLCRSCNEPVAAHVRCYTHQQGSLIISVRSIPSLRLPGGCDGKIWMWHRCLKCSHSEGIPPASRRVVMSDAAWGLSFGKFLELSFSNHATANRVASCGHSLQRDCLRFYGFGGMVAIFRYSSIDILSVHLPPLVLEFDGHNEKNWIHKEALQVSKNMDFMYAEVFDVLQAIEHKLPESVFETSKANNVRNHIAELKDLLKKERNEYEGLLQLTAQQNLDLGSVVWDILELNRLRRCLVIDSYMWDRRLFLVDSFLKTKCSISGADSSLPEAIASPGLKRSRNESFAKEGSPVTEPEKMYSKSLFSESPRERLSREKDEMDLLLPGPISSERVKIEILALDGDAQGCDGLAESKSENVSSPASNLSDKIDLAWTGSGHSSELDAPTPSPTKRLENLLHRRIMAPGRVHSFDSGLRLHDKVQGLSPASLHLSSVRSFHASGDIGSLVHDPISKRVRAYTQTSPMATQKLNFIFGYTPSHVLLSSQMVSEGAHLLLPLTGSNNIVIAVYDNEPTSVVSYALSSKSYMDYMTDKVEVHECWSENESNSEEDMGGTLGYRHANSARKSNISMDLDDVQRSSCRSNGSEDSSLLKGARIFLDSQRNSHVRVSFDDESSLPSGRTKFSVTCYFAKEFDALRKKCCPSEVDFLRSLCRCKKWSAQGGKSNVYFAKTLDERFIIKQVTKTELESFEEFAPQYFKYLMDSLTSGSPTCLAKILGIYQVTVKHLKGGKEVKMDLMIMENLFFGKNISHVYDLKGSARSRYISDTAGDNKVLLDLNLLEALRTKSIFLGSRAKRKLERAVWNDTSFLASIDVMDYSLLVGVDEERKELVLGIIDYMRQYTWDKHLETWVKASGILGGPKNASPTVISPKQYKKRFRKAMSSYFLTVPDQWSA